jgi:hypothetical protein
LAPRLEPTEVARNGDAMLAILEKSADKDGKIHVAATALAMLVPRLEPIQVVRGFHALIAVVKESSLFPDEEWAVNALVAFVPRLQPADVVSGSDAMITVIEKNEEFANKSVAAQVFAVLATRLDPSHVARGSDVLITVIEKSTRSIEDNEMLGLLKGIIGLAPLLEPRQAKRAFHTLIAVIIKSSAYVNSDLAAQGLTALASRLDPSEVVRGWKVLLSVHEKSLNENVTSQAAEGIIALAPKMKLSVRENALYYTMTMICDSEASKRFESTQIPDILKSVSHPRSIAKLLSHPGCVGALREAMLLRFEELALHGGQPVFSQVENQDGEPPTRGSMPQREFHNLHDAAAWIEKNWPDFDLETNHPVTWRGEHK